MKKILLILLILIYAKISVGQLLLTGTVKGAAKRDSVEINLSYDGVYRQKNSIYLKPDVKGNFHTAFKYHTPKFVMLLFKGSNQWVLVSPGRPLYVTINTQLAQPFSFLGNAAAENILIQKLHLTDGHDLAFVKALKAKNSYANWSVDSVITIKLPSIMHSADSTLQLVKQTSLPPSLKKVIATEVKYQYANAVSDDLGQLLNNRKNRASFNLHFIDTVLTRFALPSKNELAVSLNANIYLAHYCRYKIWKAVYIFNTDTNKEHAYTVIKATTGLDLKKMMTDPDRGNEIYYFTTHTKIIVPQYAWEKSLTNLMFNFSMTGQLQSADKLLHFIGLNCTDTQYIADAEKMFIPLKKARDEYANNLNIRIRPDYRNVASLKAILTPYKNKVVLIDLWFTQCPPCLNDLVYEPALKARFTNKDVVFLSIAREEDKDDEVWRDFIFINNITGEHIRRTAAQMATLWNELGVVDSEQAYPRYFIVDKTGQMAIDNAKRPSEGDALYKQIESVLNK